MSILFSFYHSLLQLLFPESCFLCKKSGTPLCKKCIHTFKKNIDTPLTYAHSTYSFHDIRVKKIIHAIKYFHRKDLIMPLVASMENDINYFKNNHQTYTLIPIPMPKIRKLIRGYNQAEWIASHVSEKTSNTIVDFSILKRSRTPERQATTKTRSERLKNQHNSFYVSKDVSGLHIILIDDVMTTGATLSEARNILLKHGAKEVYALTIAH
ncbi:MAG: ComF family protein [Candidatus Pacebacteria bacterium]|nr:ComF family protein [Candidatus Paceibacterota bacterium]MBP9867076.1 ComF family protein [Candidatus Paceibacterota bacterium]